MVTKPPDWHALVAWDMLLNNLSTGLFLVAAVGDLALPAVFAPVASWAHPVALAFLLADLALLVLDLGDRPRFHHMLRVFKPGSPMSLGTWCLTAFSLFLAAILAVEVVVALDWLPGDAGPAWWLRKLLVIGGLPFAFASAAYKGVLFSTTAQPGWKDARWLGGYLTNSAVVLGAGELLVLAAVAGEERAADVLRPAVALLTALHLIPLGLLANDLHPVLSRVYPRRTRIAAGAFVLAAGVAAPVGLLLAGRGLATASAALGAIVVVSLAVRFALVRLPHVAIEA
jgi:hypothetical protein